MTVQAHQLKLDPQTKQVQRIQIVPSSPGGPLLPNSPGPGLSHSTINIVTGGGGGGVGTSSTPPSLTTQTQTLTANTGGQIIAVSTAQGTRVSQSSTILLPFNQLTTNCMPFLMMMMNSYCACYNMHGLWISGRYQYLLVKCQYGVESSTPRKLLTSIGKTSFLKQRLTLHTVTCTLQSLNDTGT